MLAVPQTDSLSVVNLYSMVATEITFEHDLFRTNRGDVGTAKDDDLNTHPDQMKPCL